MAHRPKWLIKTTLIDFVRLDHFKAMDDDQQTMTRQIVALFIKDASLRVQNIELALGGA